MTTLDPDWSKVRAGDRIRFAEDKQKYTVKARSERYLVCTKPFNLKRTVIYTVIDIERGVRGTEDLIFGMGAETREECEEMISRLESGESGVSYRNVVPLKINDVELIQPGLC